MRKDKNEKQAENETQAQTAGQDLDEKNLDEKNQNTATKEDDGELDVPMEGGDGMAFGMMSRGGKAKDFGTTFKKMMGLLSAYKLALVGVAILGIASVTMTIITPKVMARATDIMFSGFISKQIPAGTDTAQVVAGLRAANQDTLANVVEKMDVVPGSGIDLTALWQVLLLMVVLYLGAAVLGWAQGYAMNVIMVRSMFRLRKRVEEKINRLPLSYFDNVRRGDLISRVTNDIDNITTVFQQALSGVLTAVLTVIGVLAMMLSISWKLTLIVLISLPLMGVVFGLVGFRSQKAYNTQWKKVGRLNARVEESFSGHSLIKVYGQQKPFTEAFAQENEELYRASFKAQMLSGIMMPGATFVSNLVYVLIALVGGLAVAGGTMTLGSVQAFIQYAQQFNQPVGELSSLMVQLQSAAASAERIFEVLEADDQVPDTDDPQTIDPAQALGRIEFKNVRFSYNPDQELITDLSFQVQPGQKVAIVGPTGAGKTTLVNLLMRFYDIDAGQITIDGVDVNTMTRRDVRSRVGMVLQDPWLFSGTIAENIHFGNESATDAGIRQAAERTYVDHLVRSLPEGYETVLGEDASNLSAGERQLITIARAFVSEPSILILDEATSSVDTRTERMLQKAMGNLQKDRTFFVIAHRLSTIRDADLILVMESGNIVEQGNHDQLIEARGAYWRLYNSQFQGAAHLDEA